MSVGAADMGPPGKTTRSGGALQLEAAVSDRQFDHDVGRSSSGTLSATSSRFDQTAPDHRLFAGIETPSPRT
jgi:hypothetical protein